MDFDADRMKNDTVRKGGVQNGFLNLCVSVVVLVAMIPVKLQLTRKGLIVSEEFCGSVVVVNYNAVYLSPSLMFNV